MKTVLKQIKIPTALLTALCLLAGVIIYAPAPAYANTTGNWELWAGSAINNRVWIGNYTSLSSVFSASASYSVAEIRHTGTSGRRYDLGSVHRNYTVNGRTLLLTGVACTYWSGHTGSTASDVIRLTNGATLYVGTNITLEKNYSGWAAVGVRNSTANYLYNFGRINHTHLNEAICVEGNGALYNYQRSGAYLHSVDRRSGTYSLTTLFNLNVTRGANVASVSHSPGTSYTIPLILEGYNTYTSTQTVTVSGVPNTGYHINSGAGSYTMNTNRNITVTAAINTYTISYNANGGSGAPANQTKTHGVNLTLSAGVPARAGFAFTGWNTQANGNGVRYNPGAVYTQDAALTLFAMWEPNISLGGSVRIEYSYMENGTVTDVYTGRAPAAEIELLRRLPGGEYGVFRTVNVNFNTNTAQRDENGFLYDEKTYIFNDLPPANQSGAVFEYAVRVDLVNYNAAVTGYDILLEYDPRGFTAGFEITPSTSVTNAVIPEEIHVKILYYHYSWHSGISSPQKGIIPQHTDFHMTVSRGADGKYKGSYPVLQLDESATPYGYNITVTGYTLPGGGYVPVYDPPVNPPPAGYDADTGSGFEFIYNRADNGTTGWVQYDPAAHQASGVITASFAPMEYTISYMPGEGETPAGAPVDYTYGNNAAIPAPPAREGYTFGGWFDNAAFAGGAVSAITPRDKGDKTLYAKWTRNFANVEYDDKTSAVFAAGGSGLEKVFDYTADDTDKGITDADREADYITLTLVITDTDENAPGAAEITQFARGRVLQFFDISVYKTVVKGGSETVTVLTELPVPITVYIDLPDEMSGRTGYSVYRFHNSGGSQQLGQDNSPLVEDIVVSRQSAPGGKDRIVIISHKFSTYAVAEQAISLGINDEEAFDVRARIVDINAAVYKIDIEWGEMKFVYYPNDTVIWDGYALENKTYTKGWHGIDGKNNKITVTNHSNADVTADLNVTWNLFIDELGVPVYMEVHKTENYDDPAVDIAINKVPHSGNPPLNEPMSADAFLRIFGEPIEPDQTDPNHNAHPAEQFHKVGIVTVTIRPTGNVLTPRN